MMLFKHKHLVIELLNLISFFLGYTNTWNYVSNNSDVNC